MVVRDALIWPFFLLIGIPISHLNPILVLSISKIYVLHCVELIGMFFM